MDCLALYKQRIAESIEAKTALLQDEQTLALAVRMAEAVVTALAAGGKVMFAGNGGSFADSIHLAAEFVSRFTMEREPLASIALGANNSILTAIGNDYSFEKVFVRELKALGKAGDVFIALTTSGNSPNILPAVEAAQAMGISVYGLTGGSGGLLAAKCPCVVIPSPVTARIQEAHITLGHILCEFVERKLFA